MDIRTRIGRRAATAMLAVVLGTVAVPAAHAESTASYLVAVRDGSGLALAKRFGGQVERGPAFTGFSARLSQSEALGYPVTGP